MTQIVVQLRNGELKYKRDGYLYNGHVLHKELVESSNPSSNMKELTVSCSMCGTGYGNRIHTTQNWRVDILHLYLVSKFDESCPTPRKKIERAARESWKKHEGEVFTSDVRLEMKENIQNVCDQHINISFE